MERTFSCDHSLEIVLFSVGELSTCVINNIPLDHVLYIRKLPVHFINDVSLCTYVYGCYGLGFVCIIFILHVYLLYYTIVCNIINY